jgi:hypothetical protein
MRDHVELVFVYLAGFLMLRSAGPGNISLDRKLWKLGRPRQASGQGTGLRQTGAPN